MYRSDYPQCAVKQYRNESADFVLEVHVLERGVFRVRYVSKGCFEDSPTYGVSSDYVPIGSSLEEEETETVFVLRTSMLTVRVRKEDLGVEFSETCSGRVLSSDVSGPDYSFNDWTGDHRTAVRKKIKESEYFYGLGDKPCDLNLKGRRFEMWGADHYAFKSNSDPLYKNIPFFLSLSDGVSYGIFFDNTCRTFFDFGARTEDVLEFGSEGGEMDYYFFHAESPSEIIASYTRLTGLPPMPPMWALGYHQSKWSYYPDRVVRNVVDTIRDHRIPCDSVHLDIHHMKNYRSLTWDPVSFPDPSALMRDMEEKGVKPVTILNPGVKIDPACPVWKSGLKHGHYCRRHDGSLMVGTAWPGECHFPDFTNPKGRKWWTGILKDEISRVGIRGLWNDMNEPAIFPDKTFPMDTRHDYDGMPCSHGKAHNVYGHCMASASMDALLKYGKGRRPFNLSRSGYAGMQRFAATWTGDNRSTWDDIRTADWQCQRLAASGVSFAGSDAGGFLDHPTPELFCRWMQMAAFHVFFRNHSSGEYGGQEPWVFGDEVTRHVRFAIEQRYRLLPYFYTLFRRYSTEGLPMIRSLALQCHATDDTYWRGVEFFVGDHIYVVPVLNREARGTMLFVPDGVWYSLWNDKLAGAPRSDVWTSAPLSYIPVYVRGGAVIPRWPVQQYVGEVERPDLSLDLWWAPNTVCTSHHYEDAGDGMEYLEGDYAFHTFEYEASDASLTLRRSREGNGTGFHGGLKLVLHSVPATCSAVSVEIDGGGARDVSRDGKVFEVDLPDEFREVRVSGIDRSK